MGETTKCTHFLHVSYIWVFGSTNGALCWCIFAILELIFFGGIFRTHACKEDLLLVTCTCFFFCDTHRLSPPSCAGDFRTDKSKCQRMLLLAARLNPSHGETFAYLGSWFEEVGEDESRAKKCFLKGVKLLRCAPFFASSLRTGC